MSAQIARNRSWQALMFVCALLCISGQGSAHDFCVSSASELQQALTDASDGGMYAGEDNLVKIIAKTYLTGAATANGPFFFHSSAASPGPLLTIVGGYNAACASRVHSAASTMLDGQNATPVLAIRNTHGNVAVSHLTVQNGQSDSPGAGLQVNYLTTVNGSVDIENTIIRGNHSTVDAGGLYASGASVAGSNSLYLASVLIAGNSADGNYGGAYLTGYGGSSLVHYSTVTRNTAAATGERVSGLYCGGTAICNVFDNIIWSNGTTYGLYLGNAGAVIDNDYGSLGGTPPDLISGNLSLNPFFVDAAGGDFHLSGDSPMLGYCPPSPHGFDLDDNANPNSGRQDMGAYQETIFVDGFEGH
jgi:hypothetical protein